MAKKATVAAKRTSSPSAKTARKASPAKRRKSPSAISLNKENPGFLDVIKAVQAGYRCPIVFEGEKVAMIVPYDESQETAS